MSQQSCIYCGGRNVATTVEHMPPRMMFRGKDRPPGLEFPACSGCNHGSSHADLVASLIARFTFGDATEADERDIRKLVAATANNIPGLHEELNDVDPELERRALSVVPPHLRAGGSLRIGPKVNYFMTAFSLKLGLALHYEVNGQALPADGEIAVRWFTNHDLFSGAFPQSAMSYLLPSQTLRQGKKEVASQFEYAWRLSDDAPLGMYFASFRQAFSVLAFTSAEPGRLPQVHEEMKVYSPAQVGRMLHRLKRNVP